MSRAFNYLNCREGGRWDEEWRHFPIRKRDLEIHKVIILKDETSTVECKILDRFTVF